MVSFRSSFSLGSADLFVSARMRAITRRSLAVANDVANSVPGFVGRVIARQKAQARAAVAHDTSQWLVHFMRDRSRQFPHHAHAVDMRKIRLELAQPLAFFFGSLAIVTSMLLPVPLENLPRPVAQRHAAEQEPAILPIGAAHPRFSLQLLSGNDRVSPGVDEAGTVLRVHGICPTPASAWPSENH